MKQLLNTCLVLALFSVIVSCQFFGTADEDLSLEKDFKLVKQADDFAIYLPKYFKKTDDLNQEATLQFQNFFRETYLVLIEEPKAEFITLFKDLGDYNHSITPVKNYKNVQRNYFSEFIDITNRYESRSLNVHGLPTEIVRFDGIVDDVDIAYDVAYLEGQDTIYMIIAWTLKDRRKTYAKTFDMIFNSFREIKR